MNLVGDEREKAKTRKRIREGVGVENINRESISVVKLQCRI